MSPSKWITSGVQMVVVDQRPHQLAELARTAHLTTAAERAGQGTVLASPAFERIAHPSADADGQRTPALRFGDPRVMALVGAFCATLSAATCFTNTSLRASMTGLLHTPYNPGQMTYDLQRRLRLNGMIRRIEHTNRYVLTSDGIRAAVLHQSLQPPTAPITHRQPAPGPRRTQESPVHNRPPRRGHITAARQGRAAVIT